MKEQENTNKLKGTGYLIGALAGIVSAVVVFIFTENIAVSIPILAGLGIPLGIAVEQKLQKNVDKQKPLKVFSVLLIIGIVFFISFVLALKLL